MGFFDQDGSGFDPITGTTYYNPAQDISQDTGNPFDNSVRNVPLPSRDPRTQDDNQPSLMSRILSGIGINPSTIGSLAGGSSSPSGGYGIPGVDAMTPAIAGNAPPPSGQPPIPPQEPPQAAQMVKPSPMQPPPMAAPVGFGSRPPGYTPPPGGQTAAAPAPLPPGAGAPTNIAPPAAAAPQGNFLERLLGGKQGVQQVMAGIGKGAAGITSPGRFGSFARGAGLGIEGSQEQQRVDFQQATQNFNNKMKLLLTNSTLDLHQQQAALAEARQSYLTIGGAAAHGKSGDSWRATPLGQQTIVDKDANDRYKKDADIIKGDGSMTVDEKFKKLSEREKYWDNWRRAQYKEKGIDPLKGAEGSGPQNPVKMKAKAGTPEAQKEYDEMMPGTYYVDPDDPEGKRLKVKQAPDPNKIAAAFAGGTAAPAETE